jgi:hypothetical protein
MFRNLDRVRFASWSYFFDETPEELPSAARSRHHGVTYTPSDFTLKYRIAHFDTKPVTERQYPTFLKTGEHWYLASLSDFRKNHERSARNLWDFAPVHVVHRPGVLVLGPSSELATMEQAADDMHAAIPKVTAVWGSNWAQRVVVQVPSTQHEMAVVTDDGSDLDQIAALTTTELSSTAKGRASPSGDRVTINPRNWAELGSLGAEIVMTHELTHVASRVDTGYQTPKWLSEGLADYVGFLTSGLPVTVIASELATEVNDGHLPRHLPTDRAFRGSNKHLSDAYEEGWLACHYIVERTSQHTLLRFYREVGKADYTDVVAVAHAMRHVLHQTPKQFTAGWRNYVQAQLG